jgi:hypothetical protein
MMPYSSVYELPLFFMVKLLDTMYKKPYVSVSPCYPIIDLQKSYSQMNLGKVMLQDQLVEKASMQ